MHTVTELEALLVRVTRYASMRSPSNPCNKVLLFYPNSAVRVSQPSKISKSLLSSPRRRVSHRLAPSVSNRSWSDASAGDGAGTAELLLNVHGFRTGFGMIGSEMRAPALFPR